MIPTYISRYWGKSDGDSWHPLTYHMLDVAAVADALIRHRPTIRERAESLLPGLSSILPLLAALHDIGKIARPFQEKRFDLIKPLWAPTPLRPPSSSGRPHGELGSILWQTRLMPIRSSLYQTTYDEETWEILVGPVFGHHGEPCPSSDEVFSDSDLFLDKNPQDCLALLTDILALFVPRIEPHRCVSLSRAQYASWWIAGFMVLADWIGSNRNWFEFRAPTLDLETYYQTLASPSADEAINRAGLASGLSVTSPDISQLIPGHSPTPLQARCASINLTEGPQIFVIEDVTGSGKTEAALMLAWRLLSSGRADGLYFGLPTQATANAMFQRVSATFPALLSPGSSPTLCLAHGKSEIHPAWRSALSIAQPEEQNSIAEASPTSSLMANAWLADSRKKALLADVGVGTLDQALLGVLPTRHQGLRLFGLGGSVLVCDEVHAYDAYTGNILETLLEYHARMGGSAIILSATLTHHQRTRLIKAFQKGRDTPAKSSSHHPTSAYPLLSCWGEDLPDVREETPYDVTSSLPRRLRTSRVTCAQEAIDALLAWSRAGRCAAWVRNTIGDARAAYTALRDSGIAQDDIILFHASFVPDDRSKIESRVLDTFGRSAPSEVRSGKILIATQVAEQSLDIDLDEMISDLAPIDSLIQRAGRLHRHPERGDRGEAILHVVSPFPEIDAKREWYKAMFPEGDYVYPTTACLWRTAFLLFGPDCPQDGWDLIGEVRTLIETVFAPEDIERAKLPPALVSSLDNRTGQDAGNAFLAKRTVLLLKSGYGSDSGQWIEDIRARTRLGDDKMPFVLAVFRDGEIVPWSRRNAPSPSSFFEERQAWAESEIGLPAWKADDTLIPPSAQAAFTKVCKRMHWNNQGSPRLVLLSPPEGEGELWTGEAQKNGTRVSITYHPATGLSIK